MIYVIKFIRIHSSPIRVSSLYPQSDYSCPHWLYGPRVYKTYSCVCVYHLLRSEISWQIMVLKQRRIKLRHLINAAWLSSIEQSYINIINFLLHNYGDSNLFHTAILFINTIYSTQIRTQETAYYRIWPPWADVSVYQYCHHAHGMRQYQPALFVEKHDFICQIQ